MGALTEAKGGLCPSEEEWELDNTAVTLPPAATFPLLVDNERS